MSNFLKKFFVLSLTFTMTVWSVGVIVTPAQALTAGDLVKGPNSDAVYYIGADGKKYVFPDAKTYFTWYKNFNAVKTATVTELDMYPSGGTVTNRACTRGVKIVDSAKVYVVEPGGKLRWIPSEQAANDLFGSMWNKRINDVIPGYFASTYTVGADLGSKWPVGCLVQKTGEATIYYTSADGVIRPFASMDAFNANGFDSQFILNVSSIAGYTTGSSITGEESALSSINASSNVVTNPGTLSVSLASDTPASGLAASNAARYPFTKINLTTGANPVTIDTIVVKRGGVAQDGAFSSVDILDGNTMLPFDSNSKTFNSNHEATFNKDLTIPANTTWPIILSGNMGQLANYSGEVPTLGVSSITLVGGSTLSASLPIFGNYQNLNGTISIGGAKIERGSYSNATATLEVGKLAYTFFSFQVTASSTEDLAFSQISVYQEGSASLGSDITNIKLLQDGTKIADGVINGSYVGFTMASPIIIPKGQVKQFQVQADVAGGTNRNVDFGLYRYTDLILKGQTYGYNITPWTSGEGSSTNNPVLSDKRFEIGVGTLTVERSNTVAANNISIGNDQVLGAFKFTVKGEPIDVTAITIRTTTSTSGTNTVGALDDLKLVNASGTVVAGPKTGTFPNVAGKMDFAMTDSFTLPVGETVLKVVAKLDNSGGWSTNDTIYASINTPSTKITARGTVSGQTVGATPTGSAIDTNTQTVKGASMTVTRNTLPANGRVIKGAQDVLLGSWNFDATGAGEDIRITSLAFAASSSNATNLTVYDGVYGSGGTAKSPVNDAPSSDDDGATSTFAFDTPLVITKGTSKTIQLVGDINTAAVTNDSTQWGLTDTNTSANASVVAYGVSTGNRASVSVSADDGAVLTYSGAGTVTVSTYNNPSTGIARAGATGVTFGSVKLDAIYESLDLDQLIVYVADGGITGTPTGNYQDVTKVYIYDGSTLLASNAIPSTGMYTFDFSNGTLTVPKDGSKTLTIKADLGTISQTSDNSPATPGADVKFGFGGTDGFKFTGNDSNTTASETYNGSTTTAMVIHKAVPTVTFSTSGSTLGAATSLANGGNDLYKFRVSADASGNEVLLYRASFEITTGGAAATTVTGCYVKDEDGNTIGASTNPSVMSSGNGKNLVSYTFDNPTFSMGNAKEAIQVAAGSSETFTLNCTVANASSGTFVAVSLLGDTASSTSSDGYGNPTTDSVSNWAQAFTAYNQGNFVWSDNYKNRGIASDGANATAYGQWYNGYLVNGLGLSATTTAYTVGWSS